MFRNYWYLYLTTFLKYLTCSNIFLKYIVSIKLSFSLSHVIPVKLITLMHCNFTQQC